MVEYEQKKAKMVRPSAEILNAMGRAAVKLGTTFARSGDMNFQATFDALVPLGLAVVGEGDVKAMTKTLCEHVDTRQLELVAAATDWELARRAINEKLAESQVGG